jgi:enoyl-CoA hydratase/carnithine racemase
MTGAGTTRLLAELAGFGRAQELVMTGRTIGAAEAERIGLVNRVVPHERLMDEALRVAGEIARGTDEALREAKRQLWANRYAESDDSVLAREMEGIEALRASPGFARRLAALRERRADAGRSAGGPG